MTRCFNLLKGWGTTFKFKDNFFSMNVIWRFSHCSKCQPRTRVIWWESKAIFQNYKLCLFFCPSSNSFSSLCLRLLRVQLSAWVLDFCMLSLRSTWSDSTFSLHLVWHTSLAIRTSWQQTGNLNYFSSVPRYTVVFRSTVPLILFFCDLKPHTQFWNPTITPSGRKLKWQKERKSEREKNAVNSGNLFPWQRTQIARAN